MWTLEETLASQDDLDQLCADRPLQTSEVFAPNAFYGMDAILKMYAGLPPTYALKVLVPHGIVLDEKFVWRAERKSLLPAVLCYPSYRLPAYASSTEMIVIPAASPFLYLTALLGGQQQPKRRGTIFFPHHSTHHLAVQMDFEALAEALVHLDDQYQPLTVCIYWRDFNLGRHLAFERRGLRVVSAGHMYDPHFLFRFYHLCSMHRYAASNGLGSHIPYCLKSSCCYFHFDPVPHARVADEEILRRDTASGSRAVRARLESLLAIRRPFTTAAQIETVDYFLGADQFKSPEGLREQLRWAEGLDRFGFVRRSNAGSVSFRVPTCYLRVGRALRTKLGRAKHSLLRRRGEKQDR